MNQSVLKYISKAAMVLVMSTGAVMPVIAQTETASTEAPKQEAKGIRFESGTWAEIKAIAKRENKIIFVDAYTTWCGPCKYMAKNVFTDPIVARFYNDRFINAKIDMEAGEGVQLAQDYNVRAYPTFLYVAADGELVHRMVGAMQGPAFVMVGQTALDPQERSSTWQQKFKAGNREPEFVKAYFQKMQDCGIEVADDFKAYMGTLPVEKLREAGTWQLYLQYGTLDMKRELDYLKQNRASMLKDSATMSVDAKLLDMYRRPLSRAYATDGATGAEFKKLSAEVLSLGINQAQTYLDEVPLPFADPQEDVQKFISAATGYFKKHPKTENHNLLNGLAWSMYEHVDDPKALAQGTKMIQAAMKLRPDNYAYMDTHAALLYKRKLYADALKAATAAVEVGLKEGEDVSGTQELIGKIKTATKKK